MEDLVRQPTCLPVLHTDAGGLACWSSFHLRAAFSVQNGMVDYLVLHEEDRLSGDSHRIMRFWVTAFEEIQTASLQAQSQRCYPLVALGITATSGIEGKLTKPSAVYVPALAKKFAEAFHLALSVQKEEETVDVRGPKVESLVLNDILAGGEWRTDLQWFWRVPSHINILESHSYISFFAANPGAGRWRYEIFCAA